MKSNRRPLRIALTVLGVTVVVLAGAAAVVVARFDPNHYKPQIEAAVKRATGRELVLNGPIALKFSLPPTLEVRDVSLANPPGFSRPQMAMLQSMELRLALVPLLSHRIQIDRLMLNQPDILLETNAAGQPNWTFAPQAQAVPPSGTPAPAPAPAARRAEVSIESVSIQNGTLRYRDDRTQAVTTLGLQQFTATAASPSAPLHIATNATYNGDAFSLTADTGSLARLQDPAAKTPWPVKLSLTTGVAHLAVDGAIAQPLAGRGYALALNGTVPNVAALTPYLQGYRPPPLHDVSFAARLADNGAGQPEVTAFTLRVGASDLNTLAPGLVLDNLAVDAPSLDQPAKATATAKLGTTPSALAGVFGPLATLMPGAHPAPFPVDLRFQGAGVDLSAKGTIADVRALTGAAFAVGANIPDLATLGPLVRHPLPAIKAIAFHGTLTDANGGFRHGAALHGLVLNSAVGDAAGDLVVGLTARPSLTATLKSNRIDADAIRAAIAQMPAAEPAPVATHAPAAAPAQPQPNNGKRLFSDKPIPFDLLRAADANLTLAIADLHSGGADYRSIASHAVLNNGVLSIDPFAADLPGGHFQGSLRADASKPAPPVHLTVRAPAVPLKTILAMAREPSFASGNLDIDADLQGAGNTPHELAASLNGILGVSLAGGTIDNRLLGSLLGNVMDSLNALNLVGKGGTSDLRCFAMRATAQNGVAQVNPLALVSSLLTMTGGGTVNLGAETLALHMQPQARVGGTG
ncbi:MAG TPA: AsmA family protein, partial [Rhodopila sp.]|nr:AsmA family protein [Rhodopila sp.]